MKKVLPPVIENLIEKASAQEFNGEVIKDLRKAVQAVQQYKNLLEQDDLISLLIESQGDRSVGIDKEQVEIKMWRGYIRPTDNEIRSNFTINLSEPFLRKEVKELF